VRLLKYLKKNAKNSQAAGASKAESLNPSQVGSRLTELSTQRLIIIVLVSLLCFPLFEMVPDGSRTGSYDLLAILHQEHQHPDVSLSMFKSHVEFYGKNPQIGSLIYLEVCKPDCRNSARFPRELTDAWLKGVGVQLQSNSQVQADYRSSERMWFSAEGCAAGNGTTSTGTSAGDPPPTCVSTACFDIRREQAVAAWFSILRTAFVVVVLGAGIILMTGQCLHTRLPACFTCTCTGAGACICASC
jgi:hypothetical protein